MPKIPIAVLGATGAVGQRLVSLLADHPWFELAGLGASERRLGKTYGEAVKWVLPGLPPPRAALLPLLPCEASALPFPLVFSALDSSVAGGIEEDFARHGSLVATNARNHRMRPDVPLVVPEVNPSHLALADAQTYEKGRIIANPNCSTIGLVLALAPLDQAFGLEAVSVTSLQAASGAGYPGVPSLDLLDNAIPFIAGEEEKLETEPLKILSELGVGGLRAANFAISAACNRVAVTDGHLLCVSLRLGRKASQGEILEAWMDWSARVESRGLPSAPARALIYRGGDDRPQPRLDRGEGGGMSLVLGRLRPDPLFGWKFAALSHNTIRGAAGGTLLLAELAVSRGLCGLCPP